MKIVEINFSPSNQWVQPVIEILISVEHNQDRFPVLTGGKLNVDGKSVSTIDIEPDHIESVLMARRSHEDLIDQTQRFSAVVELSDIALKYIEETRKRDSKGNITFQVEVFGYLIRSRLSISSLHETENKIEFADGNREGHLMAYEADLNIHPARRDQWFLSASDAEVLYIDDFDFHEEVEISATDWTHDYLNSFDNKNRKTISYLVEFDVLPEELKEAWEHLEKADEKLKNHEDKGVVTECRDAFNSIKKLDNEFKEHLGEEKWNDVVKSANAVKDLGLHTVERNEEITLSDVQMVLNTMWNFTAYACQNFPSDSNRE